MCSIKTKKIDGIEYIKTSDNNAIRIDKLNKTFRYVSIIDIEGYENKDILQIDRNYYYLLGDKLYSLNNRSVLNADLTLLRKAKKVDLIKYIKERSYLEFIGDNRIENEKKKDLPYNMFFKAYNKVKINDALSFFDFSNEKYITNFDNLNDSQYGLHSIFLETEIEEPFDGYIKQDGITLFYDNDYCLTYKEEKKDNNTDNESIEKIQENIKEILLKKESSEYQENFAKEIRKMNDEKIEEKNKNYDNRYCFEYVFNNIYKDDVKKQLDTGFWILKEFIYNYSFNGKNKSEYKAKKVPGDDYSFLIINFVKAAEIFLYNKLCNINEKNIASNSTLGAMIDLIKANKDKFIKDNFLENEKKKFITTCENFKDFARNGNFHKHSVETLKKAEKIILNTIQFLIRIEIYIK